MNVSLYILLVIIGLRVISGQGTCCYNEDCPLILFQSYGAFNTTTGGFMEGSTGISVESCCPDGSTVLSKHNGASSADDICRCYSNGAFQPQTCPYYAQFGDDRLLDIAKEQEIGNWQSIDDKLSPGFNRTKLLDDLADNSGDVTRHQEPKDPYGNKAEWMNWYDLMGNDMKKLEKEYMKATNMSVTYGLDRDELIQGIMQSSRHNISRSGFKKG